MRWSRIRLKACVPPLVRGTYRSPQYTIDVPLISDGRIAMHELTPNNHRAMVKQETPGGAVFWGTVAVKDKLCVCTWQEGQTNCPPDVRMFGPYFSLGAIVALRPGFGPVQMFEVVECNPVPAEASTVASISDHKQWA